MFAGWAPHAPRAQAEVHGGAHARQKQLVQAQRPCNALGPVRPALRNQSRSGLPATSVFNSGGGTGVFRTRQVAAPRGLV